MLKRLPMRGTLLNTFTVAVGSLIGLWCGNRLTDDLKEIALTGLGLVTLGISVRLFLEGRNILITAISIGVGGILGHALGIGVGLAQFAEWVRAHLGGSGRFNEGLIATSVLFCVGPMTILGCLQDGLEGKIDLLALKSVLDGIAALFFAAAMGTGVLVTALVVLVVQGTLTMLARQLRFIKEDPSMIHELSAAGGGVLMAIGFGLTQIKAIPAEDFLPALFLAPLLALASRLLSPKLKPSAEDLP